MPRETIYPRDYRTEAHNISQLPDSPKDQTLVEIRADGVDTYPKLSPRGRATLEWAKTCAVPYYIARLYSSYGLPGSPVHRLMESLRFQLRRAGITARTPDEEFSEVEAFARQRLRLSAAEFRAITTEELIAHIRHKLDELGFPSVTWRRRSEEAQKQYKEIAESRIRLSVNEAATLLGVTSRRVRGMRTEGKLTAAPGARGFITAESLRIYSGRPSK